MTRINTIPPAELHTRHLLAEYRELPRVIHLAYNAEQQGLTPATYNIPTAFTLGAGHVKFFTNKLIWIYNRFDELVRELEYRGINIQYRSLQGKPAPKNRAWWNDWVATEESKHLIRQRIKERIKENPHYYS